MKYEVSYLDKFPTEWEPIAEDRMRRNLSGAYRNVDMVVAEIDAGRAVRTPFAEYRLIKLHA